MRRVFTPEFLDDAQGALNDGATLTEVARARGCSADNLSKALRARGFVYVAPHRPAHNAKQVDVRLSFLPERIQLSVKDDGLGFDAQAPRPGHYGLINLQERANKVGATVNVEAKPGAGVHVTFSVPLTE